MSLRFHATRLAVALVVLVAAPTGRWQSAAAEEGQERQAIGRIERLLSAGKLERAERLATETFGDEWCRPRTEVPDADKTSVPPAYRQIFKQLATLGVLARRLGRQHRAADCARASLRFAQSTREAAAGLFELGLVVSAVPASELSGFLKPSSCEPLWSQLSDVHEDVRRHGTDPSLHRQVARALWTQSLTLYPSRAVIRRMNLNADSSELQGALRAYAPESMSVSGPHRSASDAFSEPRVDDRDSDRGWTAYFAHEAPRAEATSASEVSTWGGCSRSQSIVIRRGGQIWTLDVVASYDTNRCGGYGDSGEIEEVQWVDPRGSVLRVKAREHMYIRDAQCGNSGTSRDFEIYCTIPEEGRPTCMDFGTTENYDLTDGYSMVGSRFRYATRARVDAAGKVHTGATTGPAAWKRAIGAWDGRTLSQVESSLDDTIERAAKALSCP